MTKKDYKKFAAMMGRELAYISANSIPAVSEWDAIRTGMEVIFAEDNPGFDKRKFEEAIWEQKRLEEEK